MLILVVALLSGVNPSLLVDMLEQQSVASTQISEESLRIVEGANMRDAMAMATTLKSDCHLVLAMK